MVLARAPGLVWKQKVNQSHVEGTSIYWKNKRPGRVWACSFYNNLLLWELIYSHETSINRFHGGAPMT
jgi:hypothetical protein